MNADKSEPKIIVMGIGDGGTNAINRLAPEYDGEVELVAVDTDTQVLAMSEADRVIQIGEAATKGTGTGGDVNLGKAAAEEEQDKFRRITSEADLVFLTSGFGGGTGTGATPVIASTIQREDLLSIGVITTPFPFEGDLRKERATAGIDKLEDSLDALIVVSNAKLLESLPSEISMMQAFKTADEVLQQGIQGVADLITYPGLINLDLADLRSVLKGVGKAIIGIGRGSGEEKALQAARSASSNPLLEDGSIKGATRLVVNITGGEDLTLEEVKEAAEEVKKSTGTDSGMILGAVIKEDLNRAVNVTVIATNFHQGQPKEEIEPEYSGGPIDLGDVNVPAFLRQGEEEGS